MWPVGLVLKVMKHPLPCKSTTLAKTGRSFLARSHFFFPSSLVTTVSYHKGSCQHFLMPNFTTEYWCWGYPNEIKICAISPETGERVIQRIFHNWHNILSSEIQIKKFHMNIGYNANGTKKLQVQDLFADCQFRTWSDNLWETDVFHVSPWTLKRKETHMN